MIFSKQTDLRNVFESSALKFVGQLSASQAAYDQFFVTELELTHKPSSATHAEGAVGSGAAPPEANAVLRLFSISKGSPQKLFQAKVDAEEFVSVNSILCIVANFADKSLQIWPCPQAC